VGLRQRGESDWAQDTVLHNTGKLLTALRPLRDCIFWPHKIHLALARRACCRVASGYANSRGPEALKACNTAQSLVSIGLIAQYWYRERWFITAVFFLMGPNNVVFNTFAFAILSQCVDDTKRAATSGVRSCLV
jgi:hypothetical protein